MGVFNVKYKTNGTIACFKTQLVVQSFSQVSDIDFKVIFVPIIRKKYL